MGITHLLNRLKSGIEVSSRNKIHCQTRRQKIERWEVSADADCRAFRMNSEPAFAVRGKVTAHAA